MYRKTISILGFEKTKKEWLESRLLNLINELNYCEKWPGNGNNPFVVRESLYEHCVKCLDNKIDLIKFGITEKELINVAAYYASKKI